MQHGISDLARHLRLGPVLASNPVLLDWVLRFLQIQKHRLNLPQSLCTPGICVLLTKWLFCSEPGAFTGGYGEDALL